MTSASPGSSTSRIAAVPTSVSVGGEQRHDAVGDELVERLHVVGQARDQHARLVARVEADRQRLQVREELEAQVLQRALADPADQVGLQRRWRPQLTSAEARNDQRRSGQRVAVAVRGCRRRSRGRRGRAAPARRRWPAPARRTSGSRGRGRAAAAPAACGACARAPLARRGRRSPGRRAGSQARHLALRGLAGQEDLVGQPLLGDLAVEVRVPRAARRGCRARRSARPRAPRSRRPARSWTGGGRSRTWCGPRITSRSASLIRLSVVASTLEVASSRIRMRGSASSARAIATRWRWPPESGQPALADQRVVAVGQLGDEARARPARRGGARDLLVARRPGARRRCSRAAMPRTGTASSETSAISRRSEARSTRARRRRRPARVPPVGVVEARDQRSTSVVLPEPVAPTSATVVPGLDVEVDVAQDRLAVALVAEASRRAAPRARRRRGSGAASGAAPSAAARGRASRRRARRRPPRAGPCRAPRRASASARSASARSRRRRRTRRR